MAIFPNLRSEGTVQVNDRTRLDATGSFGDKSEAAITLVEIEPEASAGYIDVTGTSSKDWYLDYEYATDGAKTVSVRVTTDGAPTTQSFTLTVKSVADDKLFSEDSDLLPHEPDIMKWVPKGRNSYLNIHRRAQERIMAFLDEKGYTDTDGNRLVLADIVDIQEVTEWSKFLTLRLIFEGISNAVDDIFMDKAKKYKSMEVEARNRAILRVDVDGSGTIDDSERVRITSSRMYRV